MRLVFEGPVLGPAKDWDWTGPGPERTAKLKDRKRPDHVETAKDRCEPDRLRPVFGSVLIYLQNVPKIILFGQKLTEILAKPSNAEKKPTKR